jgi:hypothetical protein
MNNECSRMGSLGLAVVAHDLSIDEAALKIALEEAVNLMSQNRSDVLSLRWRSPGLDIASTARLCTRESALPIVYSQAS